MDNYDYLAKIYDFARENNYKVKNLNVGERRNHRGRYNFVSLELVIPVESPLENTIHELEKGLEKDKEVNSNEI